MHKEFDSSAVLVRDTDTLLADTKRQIQELKKKKNS